MAADLKEFLSAFSLSSPVRFSQLSGGANNRVYKLELANRDPIILKCYFQHPHDLRQRLNSEFSFLDYGWNSGLQCIPQPISFDTSVNAALYSYIPGRTIQGSDLTDACYSQAVEFFHRLNQPFSKKPNLLNASEACFTLQEHVQLVENRILRLSQNEQLSLFINTELRPVWEEVKKKVLNFSQTDEIERCISPSDFGFHNALLQKDGHLAFIDFEYAGWDDPAKTVCDFFCQPKIPVPFHLFLPLSKRFVSCFEKGQEILQRIHLLLPLYQVKWSCIVLNKYLKAGEMRRIFAQSEEQTEEQFQKARNLLTKAKDMIWLT
jgi:thiamine kinase-like enzyme